MRLTFLAFSVCLEKLGVRATLFNVFPGTRHKSPGPNRRYRDVSSFDKETWLRQNRQYSEYARKVDAARSDALLYF